ncbi:MAG: arylsulfatase B, partial [Arcticibacterium sp.]
GVYKLIVNSNGNEEMYDLANDQYEHNNLFHGGLTTEQERAKVALEEELSIIRN